MPSRLFVQLVNYNCFQEGFCVRADPSCYFLAFSWSYALLKRAFMLPEMLKTASSWS